jgi:hypothetical protein
MPPGAEKRANCGLPMFGKFRVVLPSIGKSTRRARKAFCQCLAKTEQICQTLAKSETPAGKAAGRVQRKTAAGAAVFRIQRFAEC